MTVPLHLLVEQLRNSGILAGDTIKEFIPPQAAPKSSDDLVRDLVRNKKLTVYQANEISQGKAASLVLGNYVLLERIGAGAMGQVFKAEHRRMRRIVAIKLLAESANSDPNAILRFEREVAAAAKIIHPNLVTVHDADCVNGIHFFVMDFIAGRDLSVIVNQDGPISVRKAVDYILQAAKGLEAAHHNGIVHRDIKPANLVLDSEGTIKILDLGLARLSSEDDTPVRASLTSPSTIMGTVDYMSPEQALDTRTADGRTDIYALGCTLHYLLTGRTVFDGGTMMKRLLAHREEPVPSLQTLRPEVPYQLDSIFKTMVAKSLDDRYQSMHDLIIDIKAFQQDNQETAVLARPASLSKPHVLSKTVPPTEAFSPTPAEMSVVQAPVVPTQVLKGADCRRGQSRFQRRVGLALIGGMLLMLGLIVFSLKSKSGTLVVTVNESEVQVDVLDPEGKVEITRKGGLGKISIAVDPGKHRLQVTKDGFSVFGQDFEIQQGDQQPITAKLIPLEKADSKGEPSVVEAKTKPVQFPSQEFDDLVTRISVLPAEKQLEAVRNLLQERNPGFDGKLLPMTENGVVTELRFVSDNVTDISPIRALPGLVHLSCGGSDPAKTSGRLADLSPLKGMHLSELFCPFTQVSDLAPISGMPLVGLNLANTQVSDLSPISRLSLTVLDISGTNVTDLSPLHGMPLKYFSFANTHVNDLSPVKHMPFVELHLSPVVSDLSPLRDMPLERLFLKFTPKLDSQLLRAIQTLVTINGQPRVEFCKALEAYQTTLKRPLAFEDPKFDTWVQNTISLPSDQQVRSVIQKLQELNPGFDGKIMPTIEHGTVAQLELDTESITDLSPLRVFHKLESLNCSIIKEFSQRGLGSVSPLKGLPLTSLNIANTHVSDLSPLQGMPLTRLQCYRTNVSELSPLAGMPLSDLSLIANPVCDLTPLKGLPLTALSILSTPVTDLTPLRGLPLMYLECSKTDVKDLTPLKELPLVWLSCDLKRRQDIQLIGSIKTLATINGRSVSEFWRLQQASAESE